MPPMACLLEQDVSQAKLSARHRWSGASFQEAKEAAADEYPKAAVHDHSAQQTSARASQRHMLQSSGALWASLAVLTAAVFAAVSTWQFKPALHEAGVPVICAHGGDHALARQPPATLAAYLESAQVGRTCIEVDVVRSRDGRLHSIHPKHLQVLANDSTLQAGQLTGTQLAGLTWPGGQHVPSLHAVLEVLVPQAQRIILDLKPMEADGVPIDGQLLVASVAELLQLQPCRQCLLWCKADEVVELLHEELPEQLLGYVAMPAEADRAGLPPLRLAFPQVLGLHWALATPALVQQAHQASQQVYAWTVNTAAMLQAVQPAPVDAIVTDVPAEVSRLLRKSTMTDLSSGGDGYVEL